MTPERDKKTVRPGRYRIHAAKEKRKAPRPERDKKNRKPWGRTNRLRHAEKGVAASEKTHLLLRKKKKEDVRHRGRRETHRTTENRVRILGSAKNPDSSGSGSVGEKEGHDSA